MPDARGNVPDLHFNEAGIALHHSQDRKSGRLIRASRWYAGENYGEGGSKENFRNHYAGASFSDDHGRCWRSSIVPGYGFSEAGIVERKDGALLMNLRRHWAPPGTPKHCRWSSISFDSGETWSEPVPILQLPDGPSGTTYGLCGGFVRCGDLLVFSNVVSKRERRNGHFWISSDDGASWVLGKMIEQGGFAYSSLAAMGSSVYVLYEGGPKQSRRITFAELDMNRA